MTNNDKKASHDCVKRNPPKIYDYLMYSLGFAVSAPVVAGSYFCYNPVISHERGKKHGKRFVNYI